jgi:pimeloyl-ACP methyl ester carboxylesterase
MKRRKSKKKLNHFQCMVFVLLLVTILSCQKRTEIQFVSTAVVVDSVASADGVMIHYDVRGRGEPALVFIHGWCCDRSYWKAQVDTFAQRYRVVTLDLAGHGESGLSRREWTIPAFGADVKAVVEKLGLERIILIGHSMGGPVALDAARQMPGRIIGLIGVDTFQNFEERFSREQFDGFLAPFQENFKEATAGFVRSMFPASADSDLVAWVVNDMSSAPPEVGLGAMEGMYAFDPKEVLRDVRIPIRSISADMWPTNVESNRRVAASFDVLIMKGHGHFLHKEDPATFNNLLWEAVHDLVGRHS